MLRKRERISLERHGKAGFTVKALRPIAAAVVVVLMIALSGSVSERRVAAGQSPQDKPQLKLALLVGINKYKDPIWPTLRGPENDVAMIRDLLKEQRFGFEEDLDPEIKGKCGRQKPESQIWTLCSEEATREAILKAFDRHLIEKSKKFAESKRLDPSEGATVVFSYSGHGSYVKDNSGDETDGVDETIVPYDAKGRTDGQILDDELRARLDELKKYTTNITIISDSCFSGSITRGFPSRGGGNEANKDAGAARVISDGLDDPDDIVTISASLPNQFARELYYPDPSTGEDVVHGALSYNLVTLIRQYPGSTYREIINLARNAMDAQGVGQTPTAEGAIDRVVFGAHQGSRKAPIFPLCEKRKGHTLCSEAVKRSGRQKESGTVLLEVSLPVGTIVGAKVGGLIAAYAPGTRQLSGQEGLIGTGMVTEAKPFSSKVTISVTKSGLDAIPENAQFVLVSPFFAPERRRVAVDIPVGTARSANDADQGQSLLGQIAEKLAKNDYVSVIRTSDVLERLMKVAPAPSYSRGLDWDVAVVSSTRQEYEGLSEGTASGEDADGRVIFLIDRNGSPIYHFSVSVTDPLAPQKVIEALELHTRVANIKTLANETSPITGKLLMKYVPVANDSKAREKCSVSLKSGGLSGPDSTLPLLHAGDKFFFEISNASTRKLFIYLYSIGSDGGISFFYPPRGASEVLPVGGVFRTCESEFGLFEVLPDSFSGPESVKLIATTSPIQAEILESPKIARQSRGTFSPLDALLSNAALNSRGTPDHGLAIDDWATVDFNYEVVR